MTETTVARWLTVAVGGGAGDDRPVNRRRLAVRVLALALLVAGVVMLAGGLVAQRLADAEAISTASQREEILAMDVGQPALATGSSTATRPRSRRSTARCAHTCSARASPA